MQFKQLTHYLTWIISGGLLLGTVGFLVLATPIVGNRALIVRSGSMMPAINVGDVVVVREGAGAYAVGDVIAYRLSGESSSVVVTHRIIDAALRGDAMVYHTKGDANNATDEYEVAPSQIIGRQFVVLPWLGAILAFAKTKAGFAALVMVPALVVMVSEAGVIVRELRRKRRALPSAPAVVNPSVVSSLPDEEWPADLPPPVSISTPQFATTFVDSVSRRLIIFIAALALMTQSTYALFSDSAVTTGNVFTAAAAFSSPTPTVTPAVTPTPSPTTSPGSGDVVINEIMWMGSQGSPSDEWIELRNMTAAPIDLSGWKLINAGDGGVSNDVVLTGTIAANGFWMLGNVSASSSAINNAIVVDQSTTTVELTNGGEQIKLQDSNEIIIDVSPVTSGSWTHGDNSPNQQSMERNSTPGDGTVVSNWHTCTDAECNDATYWDSEGNNYGTPKSANSDTF